MLTEQKKKWVSGDISVGASFTALLITLTAGEQRRLDRKMPGGKSLPPILITTVAGTTFLLHFAPETELTHPRVWSKNDKPTV